MSRVVSRSGCDLPQDSSEKIGIRNGFGGVIRREIGYAKGMMLDEY